MHFHPQALFVLALFAVTLLLAVNQYIGAASITALTIVDVLYAWLVLGRGSDRTSHSN